MAVHRFQPSHFQNVLGGRGEVLKISSGDTVVTETVDAHGIDARGNTRADGPNPLTGPFWIEGARPGDTLAVTLESIEPNRESCWTRRGLAPNVLDSGSGSFAEFAWPSSGPLHTDWRIDRERGTIAPTRAATGRARLKIEVEPMIGCLGNAPAGGQAISTATSGPHGGNMDWRGARVGTTLYFPVFQAGGLFAIGDGHASQSDGEIAGTGTEVSMEVRFRVELLSGIATEWPRAEDSEHLYTIGNLRPLEDALRVATTEMALWLQSEWPLTPEEIGLLLGQAARYEVGNVFDPAYTIVCRLSKHYLMTLERNT